VEADDDVADGRSARSRPVTVGAAHVEVPGAARHRGAAVGARRVAELKRDGAVLARPVDGTEVARAARQRDLARRRGALVFGNGGAEVGIAAGHRRHVDRDDEDLVGAEVAGDDRRAVAPPLRETPHAAVLAAKVRRCRRLLPVDVDRCGGARSHPVGPAHRVRLRARRARRRAARRGRARAVRPLVARRRVVARRRQGDRLARERRAVAGRHRAARRRRGLRLPVDRDVRRRSRARCVHPGNGVLLRACARRGGHAARGRACAAGPHVARGRSGATRGERHVRAHHRIRVARRRRARRRRGTLPRHRGRRGCAVADAVRADDAVADVARVRAAHRACRRRRRAVRPRVRRRAAGARREDLDRRADHRAAVAGIHRADRGRVAAATAAAASPVTRPVDVDARARALARGVRARDRVVREP